MSRSYRILLTTWQDFGAGSIQSVQYLAEGLKARGHDVRVACPADGVLGRRLSSGPVPVEDFSFDRGWSLRSGRALATLARRLRPELIDAQESRDRKAAILARTLFGCRARLVITRRQMSSSFVLENTLYGLAADRVIAISRGVAEQLAGRGMPRRRIRVVHTGLDPRRIEGEVADAERAALRAELGLDPALPTVGVVARRKDQETLLRALPRLSRPVNALFVGIERDEALARLEERIAGSIPAGSRIAYTGFRDPVRPLYALLDVKVLTTRAEGLSQALLEAMSLGIPVATAAIGGTPELVRHEENGLHFPPGDDAALAVALERLLDEPGLRERLTARARETVAERFTAATLAEGTEAVYRELLEP